MLNQILHADCFDILSKIKNKSVELILTDPPYSISKSSFFQHQKNNPKFDNISIDFGEWDKSEIDLDILFKHYKRVLKKGGTLIIFYDIWKSNKIKEAAEKAGFKQPRVCQWVKNNATPINSKHNYLSNAIEYFFTFVKAGNPTFNSEYDKGIYNYPICHGKERTDHPTQKPLNLIKEIIQKHSNEGDLILDTFAGSGTIGVASKELNRNYILIEKELKYYNICLSRINI
jgi:site-specific DNA-methyltransferase (adenine-specific)